MVKYTVRTTNTSGGTSKVAASRKLVAKAAQLLRSRNAMSPRAPLRTGGFYGTYNRRGRDELKFIDVTSSGTIPTTGNITGLNGVGQGSDYNQRIGRKIIMKSIYFRIDLVNAGVTANVGDLLRILIVYDCQTNSSTPAISDILQTVAYNSPMNLDSRDRYKVLIDKHVTIHGAVYTSGTLTQGDPQPKIVKVYKKLNLETIFSGTGSSTAGISTGAVWLVLLSAVNNVTSATMYNRIRFSDS